jgi:colanic acid/amylovoran biosynthesis glycosyltransferase
MRIAFLVGSFPSLSETFILNQITALLDRGHDLDIYACPSSENKVHPDVEKYKLLERVTYVTTSHGAIFQSIKGTVLSAKRLASRPGTLLGSLNVAKRGRRAASLKLLHWAAAFKANGKRYDVVHGHFGPNGLRAVALREIGAIHPSTRVVTTFYGYDVHFYPRRHGPRVYQPLFNQGDLILALSQTMKSDLAAMGCLVDKLRVHHIGIDLAQFAFTPRQPPADNVLRLVSIARLVEKKGLEYAIKAVAQVAAGGQKLVYNIIGDGEMRPFLEDLAAKLNLAGTVNLLGWKTQTEVLDILQQSHILLSPSVTASYGDQEGTPVALMEAMAMGMPVIGTTHSGIPEMIRDNECGYLVPERDSVALGHAISRLAREASRWTAMGRAGRSNVEQHFEKGTLCEQLIAYYRELIDHSGRTPKS